MKTTISSFVCLGAAFMCCGCNPSSDVESSAPKSNTASGKKGNIIIASASLSPASGSNVRGMVNFIAENGTLRVEANLGGLTPGEHGFHIHETGDCSAPDASSAGGHFNPTGMAHAGPEESHRHVGDFGNLVADASGNATYAKAFSDLKVEGDSSIIGKAVIVHVKADDLKTQPSGDAGGRVACGVIEKK